MSKRNTSKILIIVPHGVRIQFIRKKKSINGNIWRVPPQNKDWDEDLKALNGREAIPAEQKSTSETNNIELTM